MNDKKRHPSDQPSFVELFNESFKRRMALSIAHDMDNSIALDKYRALAYAVRDQNKSPK